MYVDFERAWLRLKQEVASKPSHGKRDLLTVMGELEVECMSPEAEEELDDLRVVEEALRRLRESRGSRAADGRNGRAADADPVLVDAAS